MISKICRLVCEWFYSIFVWLQKICGQIEQPSRVRHGRSGERTCVQAYICMLQPSSSVWLYTIVIISCCPLPWLQMHWPHCVASRWRRLHGAPQACITWLHDHGLHGNHLHDINCPLWQCATIIGGNGFFSRHCHLRCSTRCRRHRDKVHQRWSWEENNRLVYCNRLVHSNRLVCHL